MATGSHAGTTQARCGLDAQGAVPLRLPVGHTPVLLVVLDTEEEFDWSAPLARENRGVTAIDRLREAQLAFEDVGIRPTYVIDHPVAATPRSAAVLGEIASRGTAEIGAHLHPWVTPPHQEIVSPFNSYAGNLAPELERAKLAALVDAIRAGTGVQPVTYKAGRYGFGVNTPQILRELGLRNDLSSSPGFNWSGDGGPDYSRHPNFPYWLPAAPGILEIPTTGGYYGPLRALGSAVTPVSNTRRRHEAGPAMLLRRLRLARRAMLSPEGFALPELQALADTLLEGGIEVLSLSFHSPSLQAGHTPFVRSAAELAAFEGTIRAFAKWFFQEHRGSFMTASELRATLESAAQPVVARAG